MTEPGSNSAAERARRRRLAEVFGDVLPEATSDDTADSESRGSESRGSERWYRENRPPHHGAD